MPQDTLQGATATAAPTGAGPSDPMRIVGAVGGAMTHIKRGEAELAALEPPTMPTLSQPPGLNQPTDPVMAFGQPAMWLAIFGSMLTRRPLTTAVIAAGQVMQSTQALDVQAAKMAYDTWKVNSDNAAKLYNYQNQAYRNAVSRADGEIRGGSAEARAGVAELQSYAAAFKDEVIMQTYAAEGLGGVKRLLFARKASADGADAGVKNFDKKIQAQLFTGMLTASDELAAAHASGDPNAIAAASAKVGRLQSVLKTFNEVFKPSADIGYSRLEQQRVAEQVKEQYQTALFEWRQKTWTSEEERKAAKDKIDAQYKQSMESVAFGNLNLRELTLEGKTADRDAIKLDVEDKHPDWTVGQVALEVDRQIATARHVASGADADRGAIKSDIEKQHPEWTVGQVAAETEKQFAAAKARPGTSATAANFNAVLAGVRRDHPDLTDDKAILEANKKIAASKHIEPDRARQQAAVEAGVASEHPDWPPDQVTLEANKRLKSSAPVSGIQYINNRLEAARAARLAAHKPDFTPQEEGALRATLEGRRLISPKDVDNTEFHAQALTTALDAIQHMREIMSRTPLVAGGIGTPLRGLETMENIMQFSNDTDRHDFDSAVNYLRLNGRALLQHANPTSRALAADRGTIERIIRGENWGDTYQNVMSSLANTQKILTGDLQLLSEQFQRGTGGPLDVPGLRVPGAATPAGGAAPVIQPFDSDPDAE